MSEDDGRKELLEKAVNAARELGLFVGEGRIVRVDLLLSCLCSAITVWQFSEAPKELRDLSTNGGDEDWVMYLPPHVELPMWAEGMSFDSCGSPSVYELPNGAKVVIGSHA